VFRIILSLETSNLDAQFSTNRSLEEAIQEERSSFQHGNPKEFFMGVLFLKSCVSLPKLSCQSGGGNLGWTEFERERPGSRGWVPI
jgi:hypothetical protein